MRRVLTVLLAAGVLVAVGVPGVNGAPSPPPPKDTQCTGALAGGPYNNIVAVGPCDLTAVTLVNGDVRVQPGASLSIGPGSAITINHDVMSTKADYIDLES